MLGSGLQAGGHHVGAALLIGTLCLSKNGDAIGVSPGRPVLSPLLPRGGLAGIWGETSRCEVSMRQSAIV